MQSRVLDWADSATLYQSSLKGSPHSVKLFYNLGAVSEKRGDLVRADLSYQSVLRLQPEYEPAIAGLGNIRLRLNDPKGAADLYRQALAIKPDDAGAVTNYAASLAALGDLENAEVQYKRPSHWRRGRMMPTVVWASSYFEKAIHSGLSFNS